MFNHKFNSLNRITNGFSNGNYTNPCNTADCSGYELEPDLRIQLDNILDSVSHQQEIVTDPLQPLEPIVTVFFEED